MKNYILLSLIITIIFASCTSDPNVLSLNFPNEQNSSKAPKIDKQITIPDELPDTIDHYNESLQINRKKQISDSLRKIDSLRIADSIKRAIDSLKLIKKLDSLKRLDSLRIADSLAKIDSIQKFKLDSLRKLILSQKDTVDTIAQYGYAHSNDRVFQLRKPPQGYLIGNPTFIFRDKTDENTFSIPLIKITPKNDTLPQEVLLTIYGDREKLYPKYIMYGIQKENKYISWTTLYDYENATTKEATSLTIPTSKQQLLFYYIQTSLDTLNVKTEILELPRDIFENKNSSSSSSSYSSSYNNTVNLSSSSSSYSNYIPIFINDSSSYSSSSSSAPLIYPITIKPQQTIYKTITDSINTIYPNISTEDVYNFINNNNISIP